MKKRFLLLSILFVVIIIVLVININKSSNNSKEEEKEVSEVKKELQIINLDSKTRPIAIMINNIDTVVGYQSGLDEAYLVYEMMVEGGYTRLMALFKDKTLSRVGPVRSSRHYFLDYAKENDAVYVHFGWSPQAEEDIKTLNVDNINFMTYDGYIRDTSLDLATEHTVFTTTDNINAGIEKYDYDKKSDSEPLLNYSVDDINLETTENVLPANNISLKFSNNHVTTFTYDEQNKVYLRSQNNLSQTDYVTKKQYETKNIIIYQIDYETISNDQKGRQTVDNVGTQTGYYITNGYAINITISKSSRTGKTKYIKEDGTELTVNDGNTYIEIVPTSGNISIN